MTFTIPLPDAKEGLSNEIFARPANLYALLSEKEPRFDSVTLPERKRFRCPRLRCLAADYFQNVPSPCPLPKETSPVPERASISFPHRTARRRRTSFPAGFYHLSAIKSPLAGYPRPSSFRRHLYGSAGKKLFTLRDSGLYG